MPKALRYLRIAFSATCLIACGILIALWVRSYWKYDELATLQHNGGVRIIVSARGQMRWGDDYFGDYGRTWNVSSLPLGDPSLFEGECLDYPTVPTYRGLVLRDDCNHTYVPHWFAILIFGLLAAIPLLRWQFSLRTLLVATTLIAMVLGLKVWMSRAG